MTRDEYENVLEWIAERDALKARLAEAERLLAEAVADIGEWAGYASPYFQEKHDLVGCLAKYTAFFRTADSASDAPDKKST